MTFAHQRQTDALIRIYQDAEAQLAREVTAAVASGKLGTASYRRQQLAQVQALLVKLQADTAPKATAVLQASYTDGLKIAQLADVSGALSGIHTEAVEVLADNLSARLGNGITNVGRQVEDVFRKEGLRISGQQLAAGNTRLQASKQLTESLADQGIRAFTDVAGREWGLSRYTEMVLRTTTREAVSLGTKNRLIEGGIDLVTWDSTGESCPICDPLDGQTFSLTGATEGYDVIEEMPPIHPNCECVITPASTTFEELEAALGLSA